MATSYHQLGMVAEGRGQLDDAERWYKKSLEIKEALGNRPGMALTLGQLGLLAEQRGNKVEALDWTIRCVALFDEFPHPMTGPGPLHLVRLTVELGLPALAESWRRCTGKPLPPHVRSAVEASLPSSKDSPPMTSSPADLARRSAEALASSLGPDLPVRVEAELARRPGAEAPTRFLDPVSVSLAALVVSVAKFAWDIYRDLKKDSAKPRRDVVARSLRVRVTELHGASTVQRDRIIEVVVSELERGGE
jgi:hypothetical protein